MLKDYKSLELDKILAQLANETTCADAAELAMQIEPDTDPKHVARLLQETDDAFVLMAKFGAPSFYGMTNVTNALRRAQAGGVLNLAELLAVAATLRAIRSVSDWRKKSESIKTALDYRFETLQPNKFIEERIAMTVVSEEEVADTASVALASIRRKIRAASLRVREQLDKLIRSQTYQKYLQEAIVTQRSGRYVVPVKAEFRNEIKGLVHDSSGSGATVFIEPIGVVEANNEIRVLRADEQDEIDRILAELSREVGEFADGIVQSYRAAVELNLIFAKGQLAYKMKGIVPKLNDAGRVNIKSARHPLIDKNKVVPTDLVLGGDFDALIVTGPNTGGKTVSLKTAGLLTLMTMCGLMIPAADGSEVSVFRHVLADIGDEQSIEQSLSTFSAHMTNIIRILGLADDSSLILIDELGAGTDPVEGAALAISIIEAMRAKGARIMATTHYAELKAYALQTDGVENGCCEFDVSTLRPTYRLLIGVPGKSNAFAISKRLGMPEGIVERAKTLVSEESTMFEEVVSRLEDSRRRMENERRDAEQYRIDAERMIREAEAVRERAEKDAKNEVERARQEAATLVQKTRQQAQGLLDELDALRREKQAELSAEQKARLKAGIRDLEKASDPVHEKRMDEEYVLPRPLRVGDNVLIYDIDKAATVLELPKTGDMVLVQAGIVKTRVPMKNLRLTDKKAKEKKLGGHRNVTKVAETTSVRNEIDVRGMNVEEAILEVDAFIDHALLRNLNQLTIIHGKGTGVLRSGIQQHLKRHKAVKSFRLGVYGEGESGVTVVELK
ncbi:endonuclease MutS2 [Anaeromassilibacillus senegalensis]|uniref:Endonuclease MutS2 n=1 Tax=Anaeromassilibacillus senegalensis TaxID=1673717 RepID=A0ABS9CPI0_9FIRM|nr:endonuclease MutS2 [Anaeromassilibacillus senegalensis]MCF2653045.1 endonuclease MutS2 [Anaeromassilibacillus senegalensis]